MAKRNECPCGSGMKCTEQYDGHAIFLCYTCPKCHIEKMKGWRPDIMSRYVCDEPIEPED
jgi:hypothetical protein